MPDWDPYGEARVLICRRLGRSLIGALAGGADHEPRLRDGGNAAGGGSSLHRIVSRRDLLERERRAHVDAKPVFTKQW